MAETVQNAQQEFFEVWKEAFAAVVGQLGPASPSAAIGEVSTASIPAQEEIASRNPCRFACSGALDGEILWLADQPVALRLAQLLMSEPGDPAAEYSDIQRDAFSEFVRQVAGQAAAIWKREAGEEINLAFQAEPPSADAAFPAATTLQLSAEGLADVSLTLLISEKMQTSLQAFQLQPPEEPAPSSAPNAVSSSQGQQELPSNLHLLLDVELEATIRFGERELLLRDIFALMPGSVVELNQTLNEPAELLVAGRTIARGEVVVVDGNFGLRVTEVASRTQRAAALQG